MEELFNAIYEATGIDLLLWLPIITLILLPFVCLLVDAEKGERTTKAEISNTKNEIKLTKKSDESSVNTTDDLAKYFNYEVVESKKNIQP